MNKIVEAMTLCRNQLMDLCGPYYDSFKSNTGPTHCLNLIKENPQVFIDFVQDQLKSMRSKAETYRNACTAELSMQIERFNDILMRVPSVLLNNIISSAATKLTQVCRIFVDFNREI